MSQESITIHFLGDISLNNRYCNSSIHPFNTYTAKMPAADYTVGNLEAILCGKEGFNLEKKPYLYAEESGIRHIEALKLDLVSTAHNHIYDNFNDGYVKTIDFLREKNIAFVGSSFGENNHPKAFVTTIKKARFGFLNYCHPDTNFAKPKQTDIHLNVYDANKIVADIHALKKEVDFVILLLHWGGKADYGFIPTVDQIQDSRKFIDAGADAIIGHHAHCIQPITHYKGKPIIYCLGNFCFDDIVSHNNTFLIRKSGKIGLVATLRFETGGKITTSYTGIKNDHLHIKPLKSIRGHMLGIKLAYLLYKYIAPLRPIYRFYLKRVEPIIFYYQASNKSFGQKIKGLNMTKIKYFLKQIFK